MGVQTQETTNKLVVPGIKTLHQKSVAEIAEVLAGVLKSQSNIVRFEYVVGSHFNLTIVE